MATLAKILSLPRTMFFIKWPDRTSWQKWGAVEFWGEYDGPVPAIAWNGHSFTFGLRGRRRLWRVSSSAASVRFAHTHANGAAAPHFHDLRSSYVTNAIAHIFLSPRLFTA